MAAGGSGGGGKKGRRSLSKVEELNLIPVMNLVSILIPFLLMAAQFVHLAVIDSTLPAIGTPQEVEEEPDKPPLRLTVAITDKGLIIGGADQIINPEGAEAPPPAEGEERPPTIPCKSGGTCTSPDDYDYAELTRLLGLIKDEYPDEENVILLPESRIPYEVIVRVMDATREDRENKDASGKPRLLFPYVVIAGGTE